MYQNHISKTTSNRHPQFFIRRSEISFDHRTAYIESVCATLIESRFGPGRVSQLIVNLSDRPELEPAVFYDLTDAGILPCYALSPLGRKGYQVVEASFRKANQMGLLETRPNRSSSPEALTLNRGRGSP